MILDEENYRLIFEHMSEGCAYCKILIINDEPIDWLFISVNEAFKNQTGLNDVVGRWVTEVIPGIRESDPELFNIYARVSLTCKPEKFETYVEAMKMWFSISVFSPKKYYFVAVFDVITKRKENERALIEKEERFRSISESAKDAIIVADSKGNFVSWNNSAERLFGFTEQEVIGLPITIIISDEYMQSHLSGFNNYISTGVHHVIEKTVELKGKRKDGTEFPIELSLSTWQTDADIYFSAIIRDITERKAYENELKKSLDEKEVLLKEIYHRVNNNMQVVISLMKNQCGQMKDKIDEEYCKSCAERVKAMALIHQKLYRTSNLNQINYEYYLKELSNELFHFYCNKPDKIKMNVSARDIKLDIDNAVPCSLLINEILTNSFKYAFPGDMGG